MFDVKSTTDFAHQNELNNLLKGRPILPQWHFVQRLVWNYELFGTNVVQ